MLSAAFVIEVSVKQGSDSNSQKGDPEKITPRYDYSNANLNNLCKEIEDEIKERNVGITEVKFPAKANPMDEKTENQPKHLEETVTFPFGPENKTVVQEPKKGEVEVKQFDIDKYSEVSASNLDNEAAKEMEKSQPHTNNDINSSTDDKTKVCETEERESTNENSEFEDKIKEAIVSIELEENAEEGTLTDEELTQLKNKCMARLKNAAQES